MGNRFGYSILLLCALLGRGLTMAQGRDAAAAVQADPVQADRGLNKIRSVLREAVEGGRIPGAVAYVSRDGQTLLFESTGNADSGRPMTTDTLFRIASMTKPITSVAVMMLAEEGKLQLDDPLSRYVPEFANVRVLDAATNDLTEPSRPVTLRDLMTHTSGISYGFNASEALRQRYNTAEIADGLGPRDPLLAENVRRIAAQPLAHQPGVAWTYGMSTDVLGRVIEVASGQPLDRFFNERILRPLQMADTSFHVPPEKRDRLVTLYRPALDGTKRVVKYETGVENDAGTPIWTQRVLVDSKYLSGGAGLVSTANDYARFLQMLLNGGQLDGARILKPESVREMTTNQIGELNIPYLLHGDKFGLGFGVTTHRRDERGGDAAAVSSASVGSYSWGGAYHTFFWVDPPERLVAIVMTQLSPSGESTLWSDFQRAVYEAIAPEELDELRRSAMNRGGDVSRGKKLFASDALKCAVCHKVHGEGGEAGPDLSQVAGKLDRTHLIESLLDPSAQILEGFRTTIVSLTDGRVLQGVVTEESQAGFTLVDANNRKTPIAAADVDECKTSGTSLMPAELVASLSPDEFTDLIEYLETLRTGRKLTPGEGLAGTAILPDGFMVEPVASGLTGCTALEVAPDGRVFLCEQTGAVRVVKHGRLLSEPFVQLPVDATWERGLIGVTVAPDFPASPHVYVCYVVAEPYPHHVVSRFTAVGDVAALGSELILFEGDDQRQLGGNVPAGHQGGGIHFGPDGKLYIGIGDQTAGTPAQRLDTFQGKLLRINPDGSIPDDNPFVAQTTDNYHAIWALGLRNPFAFAFQTGTDRLFINDVGGVAEEINEGVAGANYGWPAIEHGPTTDARFRGPIYHYPTACITGGDFAPDHLPWPDAYRGRYFFADFNHGWIKTIDPSDPAWVRPFARGVHRPVDLRFAPDGSLYVLVRDAWVIDHLFKPGTGALLRIRYQADELALAKQVDLSDAGETATNQSAPSELRSAERPPDGNGDVAISGQLQQWHNVTITLDGPFASERDREPNPFTDCAFNVTFTHESGEPRYIVPGYFAADGNAAESGAESGTKWRAHLSPDKAGRWTYATTFSRGPSAAIDGGGTPQTPFDGQVGTFVIAPTDKSDRDFRAKGRLRYVGKHHLQFAGSKEFFLKAGPDAPETLLAYADFDGTEPSRGSERRPGEAAPTSELKTWQPHVRDWRDGDPSWRGGRGKGLIGALNYIAAKGMNTISFLPYNAGGDGDNVWPFVARGEKLHYDCSKLDQWGIVFDHATALGLHLHFKLQEQEMDDQRVGDGRAPGVVPEALDGGALGPERKLYCRELIARFGHALALNWNLGEENTQSSDEQRAMVKFIHDTDPYHHSIVVHTFPNQQDQVYRPLLGAQSWLSGVSLQNDWHRVHQRTLQWVNESAQAGRRWVVANDEQGPANLGVPPDPGYEGHSGVANQDGRSYTLDDIRKFTLWGNLMAGGAGVEYYFGYQLPQNDRICEDWRSRDRSWDYCRIALDFFRCEQVPFWELQNDNRLVGNTANTNEKFCLTKPGEIYLVYLPRGGTTELNLSDARGEFTVKWFNPRAGGPLADGSTKSVSGGAKVALGMPPTDVNDDWLAVVRASDSVSTDSARALRDERPATTRLRLIVETDVGGDPDDEQSLVRFLLYTNEWDVEGIIANRAVARDGENLNSERTGLGIARRLVDAYGQCYPTLVQHDDRYPKPELLLDRTVAGYDDTDDGVRLILAAVDSEDPRPIWFLNWGTDHGSASSCLKRALDRVLRERGSEGYAAFKNKLRLSSDDQFGEHTTTLEPPFKLWVDTFRPPLDGKRWYHRFSELTATAGGFDLRRDVLTGHGPLGVLYPTNTTHVQKEGDTPTFLYLVPTGMNDPEQPTWGSWPGRYGLNPDFEERPYYWANQADVWRGTTHRDNTLKRWAADLQNDFRARMDWCVKSKLEANHPPVVVVNGQQGASVLRLRAEAGAELLLDASASSDPDDHTLSYEWMIHPEPGTYTGTVTIADEAMSKARLTVPGDAKGRTIHVILTVRDQADPPLARYRRVVVSCDPAT